MLPGLSPSFSLVFLHLLSLVSAFQATFSEVLSVSSVFVLSLKIPLLELPCVGFVLFGRWSFILYIEILVFYIVSCFAFLGLTNTFINLSMEEDSWVLHFPHFPSVGNNGRLLRSPHSGAHRIVPLFPIHLISGKLFKEQAPAALRQFWCWYL